MEETINLRRETNNIFVIVADHHVKMRTTEYNEKNRKIKL